MKYFIEKARARLRPRTRLVSIGKAIQEASFRNGLGLTAEHRSYLNLKGRYSGRRAFLIGNGPSLRAADLEMLKGEVCFAANKIYLLFDTISWRPSFYFVEDNLVLNQNWSEIAALNCCPKFLPKRALEWDRRIPNAIYYGFHWENPSDLGFPSFGTCPKKGFFWGSTVMYSMLQFANYMGFAEVYLVGVDFSFEVPKAPPKGIELVSEGEVNHFHKDYRKPGEKWNIPNLDVQVKSWTRANEFAARHDWKIFNATRGGKLEVFQRVDFDSLFQKI